MTATATPNWLDQVTHRNVLIALSDGTELVADLYLPVEGERHPTLLSFYPYHKDDVIGGACEYARRFFTAHGYASLLVDMRGTGGSTGEISENFDVERDGKDGAEVVEWAAAQEWCDGTVGIYGISYGGIMALAVATLRPPHLRAIAPMYGPVNLFDDWIAPGGCPNCLGNYARESFMLAMDLAPPMFPDPSNRWREVWRERLDRLSRRAPYSFAWKEHPRYDEYWRPRVVQVERIEVPTFLIGGWRDLFPDAVPRSFERISAPKRLLMGPWLHVPPDFSSYEPIEWLDDALRWWDRWLRGHDNGVDEEPPVLLFVEGAEEWRQESEWPPRRVSSKTFGAAAGGELIWDAEGLPAEHVYRSDPTVGSAAGLWDPLGTGVGYALEQWEDDGRSLTFTTAPLDEAIEIVGSPTAFVQLALEDGEELQLVAKLNAVAPDGTSRLISSGWLNDDNAHEEPAADEPRVRKISMWAAAYLVSRGHRLRLSLACADFPRIWPTERNPTIRVFVGKGAKTEVHVPVATRGERSTTLRPAEPSIDRTPWSTSFEPHWRISRDPIAAAISVGFGAEAAMTPPSGCDVRFGHQAVASVLRDSPAEARIDSRASMEVRMPTGELIDVLTTAQFTRETIVVSGAVTIDGTPYFEQTWSWPDEASSAKTEPAMRQVGTA